MYKTLTLTAAILFTQASPSPTPSAPPAPRDNLQVVVEALLRNPPQPDFTRCTLYDGGFEEQVEDDVTASTSLRLITCPGDARLLIIDNTLITRESILERTFFDHGADGLGLTDTGMYVHILKGGIETRAVTGSDASLQEGYASLIAIAAEYARAGTLIPLPPAMLTPPAPQIPAPPKKTT